MFPEKGINAEMRNDHRDRLVTMTAERFEPRAMHYTPNNALHQSHSINHNLQKDIALGTYVESFIINLIDYRYDLSGYDLFVVSECAKLFSSQPNGKAD